MEERTRQEEVEIDIKEIIELIIQHSMIIILAAVCVAIFLYTDGKCKVSTSYTSSTKMYVLSKNTLEDTVNGNSDIVESILKDYQALVTSRDILEEVSRKLKLDRSYAELASQITVTVPKEEKIVTIKVTDSNPFTSMRIANTLRDVMADYILTTMNVKLFDVVEDAMVGTPTTMDKAKRNAVLGGFVVACLVMGVFVVQYLIDDSIKTAEDIENKLGLSVLASIPVNDKQAMQKEKGTGGKKFSIKRFLFK